MARLTMAKSADFKPKKTTLTESEAAAITEGRRKNLGYSQEWPRQKLRVSDLYPDEDFIRENSVNEYKYFILLIIPIVITAMFALVYRNGVYEEMLTFLENLF